MQGDSINQRVIVRKGTKVKDNGLIIRQYCEERFGFRRAAFLSIGTTFFMMIKFKHVIQRKICRNICVFKLCYRGNIPKQEGKGKSTNYLQGSERNLIECENKYSGVVKNITSYYY